MIAVNVHACPQNHPVPGGPVLPRGRHHPGGHLLRALHRRRALHRVRRLHQGLPRVLQGPGRGPGRLMAHFDLICKDCGHKFVVVTRAAIRDKQKQLPRVRVREHPPDVRQLPPERAALQPHLRRAAAQQRLRLRLLTRRRVAPSPQRLILLHRKVVREHQASDPRARPRRLHRHGRQLGGLSAAPDDRPRPLRHPARAGVLIAAYMLPFGLFQLVYGPLADRFGKLRVVTISLALFTVATALCASAIGPRRPHRLPRPDRHLRRRDHAGLAGAHR